MEKQQKLRIKTAMIVYALEESLGNYIIRNEDILSNISEASRQSIVDREAERGRNIEKNNITMLVEASYLNEIFNFAIDITKGTSYEEHMTSLKAYASLLKIFDIRNAISHPNRPFPQFYWFRAAAIASDPLIEVLGLTSVRQALSSAISENLNPPPEEWINNVIWGIPNTLPLRFDHDITGLLGREKEFKSLKSLLGNLRNNLIAVVAPGGIGKTALILQFLKDLSLDPKWHEQISSIIFCTLKNERLTTDGIEKIEAIDGLDQIKELILSDLSKLYTEYDFESFEAACTKLSSEKVLLCIDNLETLLVHSQAEFIKFNQSLPLNWRILVTSRISIDSAVTVPIDPLVKRHAENLSRNYFRKRGINDFKQELIKKIAEASNNNPLAIRLTIDAYLKGADISTSISKTQKDIALFSYRNFIDLLSDVSISVLEAIYAIGNATRSDLINLIGLNNEQIAESINELSKTTLIVRNISEIGNDEYRLSESIRDLLLINPKNIEIRQKITDSIRERKIKIREQEQISQKLGISQFDESFIEPNTDENIYVLILDLNKYLRKHISKRNHKDLSDLKERFVKALNYHEGNHQLNYHYSRILRNLKDKAGELTYLTKTLTLNPESPRAKFSLALHYFYKSDYEESEKLFESLIKNGLSDPNNSNDRFAFSVTKCYFQSLLHLGSYGKVFKLTDNWKEEEIWKILYGTYRASCLKRSIEHEKKNNKKIEQAFLDAMAIYRIIFSQGDYFVETCIEANKLIQQIYFKLQRVRNISKKLKSDALDFISNHYFEIIQNLKNVDIESNEIQQILKYLYDLNVPNNPLKNVKWYSPYRKFIYDREHIRELKDDDYTIVEVYHIPQLGESASSYLFAKDEKENQYYLQVHNFDGGWIKWAYIKQGSKLAIKYKQSSDRSKPLPATDIVEIDQIEMW